jgi:uncharacterized protein
MRRHALETLLTWKDQKRRKPLLLRGARQVGKTHLVRKLGEHFEHFVELNFESTPQLKTSFEKDLDPSRLVRELSLLTGKRILPGKTLLFFDEIQAVPAAITSLRYFYEKLPDLHVLAAGSLLDFALEGLGVPVGRVSFLHLYPMSFLEFLEASNQGLLAGEIVSHDPKRPLADAIHQKLLDTVGVFLAVGGMPEAVACWQESQNLEECSKIHHDLVETYTQDFHKYAKKYQLKYLHLILDKIPRLAGKPFRFSHVSDHYRARELSPCFDLLVKAKIAHPVLHSAGNGVPLGAEMNPKKFKVFFLDVALHQALLGSETKSWIFDPQTSFVNKGEVIESFIAQELLVSLPADRAQQLYYWHREARASQAEVDFLIEGNGKIIPVEAKSGKGGRLRSLKMFLELHPKSPWGIQFSTQNYSVFEKIHSYPLYAVRAALDLP